MYDEHPMKNGNTGGNIDGIYEKSLSYIRFLHEKNKLRIKVCLILLVIMPFLIVGIMKFTHSSRSVFMLLWVGCMFTVGAYMIGVSYLDEASQKRLTKISGRIETYDGLLPFKKNELHASQNTDSIFGILQRDFGRLTSNVVALVILIGLCVVPCLYAWFNILSNWDPYESDATGNIPVAIVSLDNGVEYEDASVNIGDKITSALKENPSLGWKFVKSKKKAVEGVRSGKYYAAMVIPKGFSKKLTSFTTNKLSKAHILYYENDKKNAVAPKITAKARDALEKQINSMFIDVLGESTVILAAGADEAGFSNGEKIQDISDAFLYIARDASNGAEMINSADSLTISSGDIISATDILLKDTLSNLDKGENFLQELMDDLPEDLALSIQYENDTYISGTMGEISRESEIDYYRDDWSLLESAATATRDSISELLTRVSSAKDRVGDADNTLYDTKQAMSSLSTGLNRTKDAFSMVEQESDKLSGEFHKLSKQAVFKDVSHLSGIDPGAVAEGLSSPILMKTETIYPYDNYGSAMASFYTVLAQWVGALFAAVLIKPHAAIDNGQTLNLFKLFLTRYPVFFAVGILQALVVSVGDLFFLEIQCNHPFLFVFSAIANGCLFTMINYALIFALEKVGLAIGLIILVIQVPGAGGTFPIQVLPKEFQFLYPYMPFHYALDAMRECIAGMYEDNYLKCLEIMIFIFIIAAALGLILYYPCRKINAMLYESMEKSEVML